MALESLVWIGAGLALLGVVGLVASATMVILARRAGLAEAALRERMGRALPVNLGALLCSILGLLVVLVGLMLS